jgi:mono/diheme cytochrome c family protein
MRGSSLPRAARVAFVVALAAACAGGAQAQRADPAPPAADETTGRMLYVAQCHGCHQAQIHWRERRIARDWAGLVGEVRRWQQNSGLAWSDDEILAVARYLNATYYRFPAGGSSELAAREAPTR